MYEKQREAEHLKEITQLIQQKKTRRQPKQGIVSAKKVEDALRNMFDYAYLGEHSLGRLKLIEAKLPVGPVTHIDRGKALNQIITDAVDKLQPMKEIPREPPPREWHPYLILHSAYIRDVANRDIMSRLYISEGTFNRTRRSAIRAIARVIGEMEEALR
jgi:hypothetical protein